METIFKILHATEDVPVIKFNSFYNENMYRLYVNNYISDSGKKIPTLFVENNNRSVKLKHIAKNIASNNKIGFYIPYNGESMKEDIFCDFLENGNIVIHMVCNLQPKTIDEINSIIREKINKNILNKINTFTKDVGYTFTTFTNLNADNIEINSIDYNLLYKNDNSIDLNKFMQCLSPL